MRISRLGLLAATLLLLAAPSLDARGKRVVFIGDSITDGGWGQPVRYNTPSAERNQTDLNHIYGHSYVMLVAADRQSAHPQAGDLFFNRGISGHTLADLAARWQEDVLDLHPDILSVLVGTNDLHFYQESHDDANFDFAAWEALYRSLLQQVRAQNPQVRLVLCTPFVAREGWLRQSPKYALREQMTWRLAEIVRALSAEFDAVCVPFDTLFGRLVAREPAPAYWIWDGIHPTPAGHRRMADLWNRKLRRYF